MLNGELKNKIDRLWETFWTGDVYKRQQAGLPWAAFRNLQHQCGEVGI